MRLILGGSVATAALLVPLVTAGSSSPSGRDVARAYLAKTFGLTAGDFAADGK